MQRACKDKYYRPALRIQHIPVTCHFSTCWSQLGIPLVADQDPTAVGQHKRVSTLSIISHCADRETEAQRREATQHIVAKPQLALTPSLLAVPTHPTLLCQPHFPQPKQQTRMHKGASSPTQEDIQEVRA